ncbi:MAG: phage/plasmid primase, P4 family [Kiritimatiellaeota bacterium]|nr:phage/plasmid primase, P4 family [Kiritimatiellota bacterium]
MLKTATVSLFNNVTDKNNEPVEIHAVLADIRNGKWRDPVEKVRAAFARGGKEAARPVKKALLPAMTPAGLFAGPHQAATLQQYSDGFILDIDDLDTDLDEVRTKLASDPYCFALFDSPSNGVKFWIKINSDAKEHKRAFAVVAAYFKTKYDLEVDQSGKDICRLCFVSYDPQLVHNPNAAVFEIPPARKIKPRLMPAQNFDDTPDRVKVEAALRYVSANCSFDDWLRIGMALHSWNPSEGRTLWDSWSRTAPERYQETAIGQHWKTFKPGAVTIATLFKQAIDAGWKPTRPERTTAHLDPVEAARAGTPYAMTDLGNAERLCAWHGDEIRWDVSRKAWRAWDGRRWAVDDALEVSRRAAKTARKIRQEAAAAPSGNGDTKDLGALLFGWAVKTESRDRLAAMLEVAKARPGIAVASDTLDADPWVLNVLNGTIDLRTGMLRPHNRADLLTKLAPVKYLPGYCCKRWERFLVDTTGGDAELIAFLQVVAGYTLTGDTSEEILLLIYGPEAAGKTTFLEALRAALGEYARTIQADLLTRQRESRGGGAASPELAGLAGARLAAGSEMEQGREIAEALAKNLTGGEPITARHLYAELFDFRPQFKLWLALNHCPKVSADDGAIWRRILRIGFEHTVPPERRDKTLKPYLRNTDGGAPAVLAWAIEGCLRWQRDGLRIPAVVKRSTAAYRQESDPLASFIEDCLKFNPAAWTAWGEIWAAYNEHAAESGTGERYRVAPKRLQERLRGHNCVSERCHTGRGWAGVEIQDGWKTGNRDACDGCDTTLQTFSNDSLLEEVLEVPSHPTQPTRSPTQKPAELDKTDHYEDEERAAIQSEGSLTSNRKE